MLDIEIRRVTLEDIELLQKIGRETFIETYSDMNTKENIAAYLAANFSIENLNNELINTYSEFYFSLHNNLIVGYLKINRGTSQTELKQENTLEIERIYVTKEFQGRKIGHQLCNKAIDISKKHKADYIWLGVWEHNPKAIVFYEKNGFVKFGTHSFKLGSEDQTDIMMKL